MKRNLGLFLNDILENIELIEKSKKGLSKKQFEENKDIIDATVRRLEIIGGLGKKIPPPGLEPGISRDQLTAFHPLCIMHSRAAIFIYSRAF